MDANFDIGVMDGKSEKLVVETNQLLMELVTERVNLNQTCEDIAWLIDPPSVNTFMYGSAAVPYDITRTDKQVDSTGMVALDRFMAICDSMITPRNMTYHTLGSDDPAIMRDYQCRLWFEEATRVLFKQRYSPLANFTANNQSFFHSLGAYGNAFMFVDAYYDVLKRSKAFRYRCIPFGEIYMTENHQGVYDGFIRPMRMNAQQILKMFPKAGLENDNMIRSALDKRSLRQFTVLHRVCARDDWDHRRIDYKGKPYASYYMFLEGRKVLGEGGYESFPIAGSRYMQGPNEKYGTSIAMKVLPSLKTLNAEKKIFLKAGHRAADPVLLLQDDGLTNMNMTPGFQNKGGWSAEGRPLVGTLPTGDIQITEEMMQVEAATINDVFMVSLFSIMVERSGMTATEVIERINEKGILIAPSMGRQEVEYLSPMIDRELDLAVQMRMLPPMPPLLVEAQGEYKVTYTSPLAKAARAQEAAGFFRTVEGVKEIVNITGDPRPLYNFNFDRALPDIADIQGVPVRWMNTDEEKQALNQALAAEKEDAKSIQAAPAAAGMIKAQAAAAKAGLGPARRDLSGGQPAEQ